jgi:hypothetical protein
MQQQPYLYLKGADIATGKVMQTNVYSVHLASGYQPVCPPGFVLSLDVAAGPRPGSCTPCRPGSYSIRPLAPAPRSTDPSCLNCPAGGDCSAGGDVVSFVKGNWSIMGSIYVLTSCPIGHKVVTRARQMTRSFRTTGRCVRFAAKAKSAPQRRACRARRARQSVPGLTVHFSTGRCTVPLTRVLGWAG